MEAEHTWLQLRRMGQGKSSAVCGGRSGLCVVGSPAQEVAAAAEDQAKRFDSAAVAVLLSSRKANLLLLHPKSTCPAFCTKSSSSRQPSPFCLGRELLDFPSIEYSVSAGIIENMRSRWVAIPIGSHHFSSPSRQMPLSIHVLQQVANHPHHQDVVYPILR